MRPTPDQIENELNKLREYQPKVKQFTAFGDNNREAVLAQIRVLEERMDEDGVYETLETEGYSDYAIDSAIEAVQWLNGTSCEDTSPAESWKTLVP